MKFEFFEKLEEKIVFKTSHIFFLVLVGATLLVMVGSVLVFLWGITPSLKPGVEKAEYPPAVAVSADEVSRLLPAQVTPGRKTAVATVSPGRREKAPEQKAEITPAAEVDSTKIVYEQAIDSMKALIPANKYLWANKGHYERGYYKVRGDWRHGKHWVVDRYGLQAKLNNVFKSINAESYSDKTSIIKTYIPILTRFEEKNRYSALKHMLLFSRDNMRNTKENMKLLAKSVDIFPVEKTDFLYKLAQFGKKNPRDGYAFIGYVNQVMPKFAKTQREKVLDKMIAGYYKYYDNINRQKEATEMFLPLLPDFDAKSQPAALAAFYKLYERKNRDRRSAIENIDNQYSYDLRNAERVLQEKKMTKAGLRYKGLIGLGGGIVFIALVALILSLLSIQRNIKELKRMTVGE